MVTRAAKAARVSRGQVWRERKASADFAAKEWEAMAVADMLLYDEAVTRAVQGELRYLFTSTGEIILDPLTGKPYVERVCSDRLLIWLLKHRMPEIYCDKVQPKTEGGANMTLGESENRQREAKTEPLASGLESTERP